MSEPRRLNTGDARHIRYTGDPAPAAAPESAAQNGGRGLAAAQAYGAPAPSQPAQAPPAAQQSAYAARRAAAPQAVDPYTAAKDESIYDTARRNAQVRANARAHGGDIYTRAEDARSGAGRQLLPSQRQEIALRQAQSQSRGVDRYAAYTTSGIDRAALEARLEQRRQAEQAARAAQAAREAQLARQARPAPAPAPAAAANRQGAPVRHINRQAAKAVPAAPLPSVQAPQAPAPAPVRPVGNGVSSGQARPEAWPAAPVRGQERYAEEGPRPKAPAGQSGRGAAPAGPGRGRSGGAGGGQPPRKGKGKSGAGGKGGKGGKGKKKLRWWQILLITLLAIALILCGTVFFILRALRPAGGALGLSALINTPKEFQGDEFNFLMIGIDREEPDPNNPDDENIGDGNTDMIMWVHFNKKENTMRMLQIPRDYMVSTDGSISNNYRLNNVAKTQGSGKDDAQKLNMAALCEQVATMFQIPIDGYVSIHIEDLIEMVDIFGGVSLNVPFAMDYGGSHLDAGYQTLNGSAVEFLVRTRHIYPDADIGRLNMQRQFYAALFRRIKEMTMFDLFRHVPAFLNWMETDLSVSDLASFAVSVLKMPSDNMMICQMPVGTGGVMFNGQSVVYPARQADADLLNQYFRENTGPVDASQLQLVDQEIEQNYGIYPSQLTPTDPNIQFMGDMMRADQEAQQTNNLDGSGVEYFEEDPPPADTGADGAEGETDGGDAAEPAA